jgi:DNA segregation ATPase FtsK/SpoIIIE, S-DNA-T family
VKHLKVQGAPDYVDAVTEEDDEEYGEAPVGGGETGSSGDSLYDQAVAVVLRDKKVSTSYVQRRLQIGYNKAASLIERMEKEGVISGTNAAGKRDILVPGDSARV